MPIRPEMKDKYPRDWPAIRAEILERDGHACKFCGVANHAWGVRWRDGEFSVLPGATSRNDALVQAFERFKAFRDYDALAAGEPCPGRVIQIVLTIAHLDHDPTNNGTPGDRPNLAALCQRCHLLYDKDHHAGNAARSRDRKAGQMRFDEL